MSIQVANGFDLVSLAVDFDLVGFHHFLDGSSDVAQPDVDSGLSDSRVGCISNCFQEFVVLGIERQCERTINDAT